MTIEAMGPSIAFEGSTDPLAFETYIERFLAPVLRLGQVVVIANLNALKGERVREIVEEAGCELLYLPAYSPDLTPIEEAFAKIKGILRSAQARTCGTLLEAVGMAIPELTPQDARGFFEHRGYRRATLPV